MSQDANVAIIKEQTQRYYEMMKIWEMAMIKREINQLYLINNSWLDRWKKYSDYNYVLNRNRHYDIYKSKPEKQLILKPELFPSEINNLDFLVPLDTFVNTNDYTNQSYLIPRDDTKLNVDFTLVSEEIWTMFVEYYGGGPMVKKDLNQYNYYKSSIGAYSFSLEILFIPSREIISKEIIETMECLRFCFEKPITMKTIYEEIEKLIGHDTNKHLEQKICFRDSEKEIVKINFYTNKRNLSIEEVKQLLLNNLDQITLGQTFNMNSFMSPIYDINIPQYYDSNQFILCEYFTSTSLFYDSEPQVDGNTSYNNSNFKHHDYESYSDDLLDDNYASYNNSPHIKIFNNNFSSNSRMNNREKHSSYNINENIKLDPKNNKNGLVGLTNLGNTCYMNTSLQCLSNCFDLTTYFLSMSYKNDFSSNNKEALNMLINNYADVMKGLWYGNQITFSPTRFKAIVPIINKMFGGFNQHDMHEFISFLLDSFHEGLNKYESKTSDNSRTQLDNTISSVSTNGDTQNSEKKKESIISELFFGMLRSTVICPNTFCNNISLTYEPFIALSLPLVSETLKITKVKCFMIFYDISISPIEFIVLINSATTIDSFRKKVGGLFRIRNDSFLITKLEKDFNEINPEITFSIEGFLGSGNPPLFLLQISPEVFGESFDSLNHLKNIYEELKFNDQLLDLASKQESLELCDIDTNKYDPMKSIDNMKWIKASFYQYAYLTPKSAHDTLNTQSEKVVFPRVMFVNRDWTFVHLYNMLIDHFSSFYKKPKEELFNNIATLLDISKAKKCTREKRNSLPFPFIMLLEGVKPKQLKNFLIEENWIEQIVPYDGALNVFLKKKLPEIKDYSKHMIQFKLVWSEEYIEALRSLNNRLVLSYEPVIKEKGGLSQCIDKFIRKELLTAENKWTCEKCSNPQLAEKKIEIVKLPTYLILHLKRFNQNMKLNSEIDFPINGLDMGPFIQMKQEDKTNCIYDLVAVGNHSGGIHGGHYYAYAKNHKTNSWFEFNDSSVIKINENELITSNAYILFYKAVNSHINKH